MDYSMTCAFRILFCCKHKKPLLYTLGLELEKLQDELGPGEQFLERYAIHEKIGSGYYGKVYTVTELTSQLTKAAKIIQYDPSKEWERKDILREIYILKCLRHPHLLRLEEAFDGVERIVIVMEYIPGAELFRHVTADDFDLTEQGCIVFMQQIFDGLSYLHQQSIAHLDLKPENIMCDTCEHIRIVDFGWAKIVDPDNTEETEFSVSTFFAPEMLDWNPITVQSDVWSVGVICYILLSGISPFWADSDEETRDKIKNFSYEFDEEAFSSLTQDVKDFLSAIFVAKEERLTAKECLRHKWLAQDVTALQTTRLNTDKLKE